MLVSGVLVLLTVAIIIFKRRNNTNKSNPVPDLRQSPESFAVSSLFEATMGMREGLWW